MPSRVSRRRLEYDSPVAEHVVFILLQDDRLAVLERAVVGVIVELGGRRFGKHSVALDLPGQPGGASELIGIRYVVVMIMRDGQIGDVAGTIAGLRHLNL